MAGKHATNFGYTTLVPFLIIEVRFHYLCSTPVKAKSNCLQRSRDFISGSTGSRLLKRGHCPAYSPIHISNVVLPTVKSGPPNWARTSG